MANFTVNRWQKLAGILKEQVETTDNQQSYKYNTVDEFLSDYAMGGHYNPSEVSPEVRTFAKQHNFDIPKMIAASKASKITTTEQTGGSDAAANGARNVRKVVQELITVLANALRSGIKPGDINLLIKTALHDAMDIAGPKGEGNFSESLNEISPESLESSREAEEDFRAAQDVSHFDERLPIGHEDDGFNSIVINDIGEALINIKATPNDLTRAEMLSKRLSRAISALRIELGVDGISEGQSSLPPAEPLSPEEQKKADKKKEDDEWRARYGLHSSGQRGNH